MEFEAIGTKWHISPLPDAELQHKIQKTIETFDQHYSRFRSDSMVTHLSRQGGTTALPDDGKVLLDLYRTMYELTEGLMTPFVGDQLIGAGYDAQYSFRTQDIPRALDWDEVMTYDEQTITLAVPTMLDFGAIGKGFIVDKIASLLKTSGMQGYVINAGGDIYVGDVSQTVYLESPHDPLLAIGEISLRNQAICASGTRARTWGKFHHILHPRKRHSVANIESTWVVAESTAVADALATALFFVDPKQLSANMTFDYVIIKDGNLASSLSEEILQLYIGEGCAIRNETA
jgi:FAD:protein FMN transferase